MDKTTQTDFTSVERLRAEWAGHGDLWRQFIRDQRQMVREAARTELNWRALHEDIERERERCKAEREAQAPTIVIKRRTLSLRSKETSS